MKKLRLLALGLLSGAILSLSTWAIENGIYTVEGGSKTVVWHDDMWGDIEITVASGNLDGRYFWGFNENTDNSVWDGTWFAPGVGTYYSGGKMYGNTNNVNNAWGGGLDNVSNGFNSGLNPERQGPCPSGYHVPSLGERNSLMIAWCNLDEECNAWYSDVESGGISGDFIKANIWTNDNKFIKIKRLGEKYNNTFNLLAYDDEFRDFFWTSSYDGSQIIEGVMVGAIDLSVNNYSSFGSSINGGTVRMDNDLIRCFKDTLVVPQTFAFSLFNDDENIWSGDLLSGSKIPEEVISGYNLTGLTKEGYTFSGWAISGSDEMFDVENDIVTTGVILNAVREINQYSITYELDGGTNSENNPEKYTIEDAVTFADATRDGYSFNGWFTDANFTTGIVSIPVGTTGDITLYAKWTENKKPSGGYSGGGGGRSSKTSRDSENKNDTGEKIPHVSPLTEGGLEQPEGQNDASLIKGGADPEVTNGEAEGFTPEFQEAYEFAKEKGITTMPTIQQANMNGKLTRIAMAKMLSYYAINVLGQKPDETRNNKFNDITEKLDAQYDSGVTLAYQLGIMGINMPNNKFRPNDVVTRAEFATALSRLLYSTPDGKPYYTTHLAKLKAEKILTNDDYKMKELRGYVMIMLMRSAK